VGDICGTCSASLAEFMSQIGVLVRTAGIGGAAEWPLVLAALPVLLGSLISLWVNMTCYMAVGYV